MGSITIESGMTFWEISRCVDASVADIEALNPGVNPNRLHIGDSVNIPGDGPTNYEVKPGEALNATTLRRIASEHGVDPRVLVVANWHSLRKADAGMPATLCVPSVQVADSSGSFASASHVDAPPPAPAMEPPPNRQHHARAHSTTLSQLQQSTRAIWREAREPAAPPSVDTSPTAAARTVAGSLTPPPSAAETTHAPSPATKSRSEPTSPDRIQVSAAAQVGAYAAYGSVGTVESLKLALGGTSDGFQLLGGASIDNFSGKLSSTPISGTVLGAHIGGELSGRVTGGMQSRVNLVLGHDFILQVTPLPSSSGNGEFSAASLSSTASVLKTLSESGHRQLNLEVSSTQRLEAQRGAYDSKQWFMNYALGLHQTHHAIDSKLSLTYGAAANVDARIALTAPGEGAIPVGLAPGGSIDVKVQTGGWDVGARFGHSLMLPGLPLVDPRSVAMASGNSWMQGNLAWHH